MLTTSRTDDWSSTVRADEERGIRRVPARRSASAEAAALKLAEREHGDPRAWLPVAPEVLAGRRDGLATRRCALADAAALKLEEKAC